MSFSQTSSLTLALVPSRYILQKNLNPTGMLVALPVPIEDLENLDIEYFSALDKGQFEGAVSRILGAEYEPLWQELLLSEALCERTKAALVELNQSLDSQRSQRRSAMAEKRSRVQLGEYSDEAFNRESSEYHAWRKKAQNFQELLRRRHKEAKSQCRQYRILKHEQQLANQHVATRSALVRLAKGVCSHMRAHGESQASAEDRHLWQMLEGLSIPQDGEMLSLREFVRQLDED